jgi:ribA/ribD-fused uncharacterized protein
MKYSLNWLKNQIDNNINPEYLFFWGHTPKVSGLTDKSCFSQWWPSVFTVDGVNYATAEHWMMAKKAMVFNDDENAALILKAGTPAEAKRLGRAVRNFIPAIWEARAYELVVEGNLHKFSQSDTLKKHLLDTGEKVIVEASPEDVIWGIGLHASDKSASDPSSWKGTNLLGFALMEVRDALK